MAAIGITGHRWQVELAPDIGGGISRCTYDGQHILRPAAPEALISGEARDMACFPLVPFSNRIENGVFTFDGRRITLPRNMGDHPHPLHGQGWRGAWRVVDQTADSASILYLHEADAWPWRYEARQDFTLAPDRFTVVLSLTNLSDSPMPAGLGLHPYFPRGEGVTLTTGAPRLWVSTSQQIPIQLIDTPEAMDFSRRLRIDDLDLDHCFAGWNRDALIEWPGRPWRLHMEGDTNLGFLVVYTPPAQDFFCVEGVENMNNAFNWMARDVETGARILAPGESHGVTTVFRVEPSAG